MKVGSRPLASPFPTSLTSNIARAHSPVATKRVSPVLAKLTDGFDEPRRTRATATKQATEFLRGADHSGARMDEANGANRLDRVAVPVESREDVDVKSPRHLEAARQVKANAGLEKAALGKLTPRQRQQYATIQASTTKSKDSVAQLSLQKLLLEGSLPGEKDLAKKGNLLDNLAAIATSTTLAKGLSRETLVNDVLQELATPSAIGQGGVGTCAPTTVAIQLAMTKPAEYARLIGGIADKKARVTMASGMVLAREHGTRLDDGTGRAVSQRLLGSAFMEIANGDRQYRNPEQATASKPGRAAEGEGAWANTLDVLYSNVMGKKMAFEVVYNGSEKSKDHALASVRNQLAEGLSVPVAISWADGGHKILLTGETEVDGKKGFTYLNPWGREERISEQDLKSRLWDVNIDPTAERKGMFKRLVSEALKTETPAMLERRRDSFV